MSGVSITFRDDGLVPALNRVLTQSRNLTPAFDSIGNMLVGSTQRRFESETGPDGRKWPALAMATIKKKKHKKILRDSGDLHNLLTHAPGPDGVSVGSNKVYAAIHQFGGKAGRNRKVTIPARPFLGVDKDDLTSISEILVEHLSR